MKDPRSDGDVLHLDRINADILTDILPQLYKVSLEKLGRVYMGSLCVISYDGM